MQTAALNLQIYPNPKLQQGNDLQLPSPKLLNQLKSERRRPWAKTQGTTTPKHKQEMGERSCWESRRI